MDYRDRGFQIDLHYIIITYGGCKQIMPTFSSFISCKNDLNAENIYGGQGLPLTAGILEKFTERNVAPGPVLKTAAS
jgi:hypothetical protein